MNRELLLKLKKIPEYGGFEYEGEDYNIFTDMTEGEDSESSGLKDFKKFIDKFIEKELSQSEELKK